MKNVNAASRSRVMPTESWMVFHWVEILSAQVQIFVKFAGGFVLLGMTNVRIRGKTRTEVSENVG
jgi:hypothetical protein